MLARVGHHSVSAIAWLANLGTLLRGSLAPVALCYHGIAARPPAHDPHGLVVREADFAAQLDQLLALGYALVSAGELWRAVATGGPRGATGLAAITLDDGLADTLTIAERLLGERSGRGTAFVLPGLLGRPHPELPGAALADAAQLRGLAGGPLELGAHTSTHADLTTLDDTSAVRDLTESRLALSDTLGRDVRGLAYPYGRYSAATVRAAKQAGYEYACACAGAGPWERFEVPREPVFPSTSAWRLRVKAAGLYAPATALADRRSRRPASSPAGL